MTKNRLLAASFFLLLVIFSLNYTDTLRGKFLDISNSIRLYIMQKSQLINSTIKRHFEQKEQIKTLQDEIEKLESQAKLSTLFATKLNQLLDEANLSKFNPSLYLTRAIAYEQLDNPFKIWVDFPSYDGESSYGLIYKNFTAGVVYPKLNRPLAYLQLHKRVKFLVLVGKEKQLGLLSGNEKDLQIRYIPVQADIKIGDEVVTSGADRLFYEGIKVGKVVEIEVDKIYKTATVTPYVDIKKPNFFYIIKLNPPDTDSR